LGTIKYKGLRKASGETVNWPSKGGGYTELFLDTDTLEIWGIPQISLGFNTATIYHDPAIIKLTDTTRHLTMQEIRELADKQYALHKAGYPYSQRKTIQEGSH